MTKKSNDDAVDIDPIRNVRIKVDLIGTSPLLMHRFSVKARRELLLPSRKKNKSTLQAQLKHDPHAEFRECLYLNRDDKTPALFHLPSGMIRQAIASAALDMPGDARKTEILRWIALDDPQINLFGVPKLHMAMARSSGMNRTPDVRVRPCFPEWACSLSLTYPSQKIVTGGLITLLEGSGMLCGIGDWRQQKGGDFGRFQPVTDSTRKAFDSIVAKQARPAQLVAWDKPEFMDDDTKELYEWFEAERDSRELGD